ncbi:MAG: ABC transporter permease [Leucobacter sp.]
MEFANLFDSALVESVMRALIPILLAAFGGLICERAGIFNIGLEGMMLIGCFSAVAASFASSNAYIGVLVGMLAGAVFSLILAYGSVTRNGDPIVLAIAMNILAIGLTSFLLVAIFDVQGVFQDPGIVGLGLLPIPFLSEIPWVGPALFSMSLLGYVALLLVPVVWFVLFRTPLGMRLRGVGERPLAAATLGVSPAKYRYGAVILSGALCGLAGAQLALGNVVQFSENMSSGRGWIAVVAVMLARAHPIGLLFAALLFGFAEGVGYRLQGNGMPAQITDAAPYVLTLIVLVIASSRFRKTREVMVT